MWWGGRWWGKIGEKIQIKLIKIKKTMQRLPSYKKSYTYLQYYDILYAC